MVVRCEFGHIVSGAADRLVLLQLCAGVSMEGDSCASVLQSRMYID